MVTVTVENQVGDRWVPTTVTLDLDEDMNLSDETIDKDMCQLPRKIAYYAELSATLQAQESRHEHEMESIESNYAQRVRQAALASSEKITEQGIKERICQDPTVTAARYKFFDTQRQHTMVEGFYRALREKASLAIAICYKQKEEIRVMNSPINQ